jgi:predicted nucleic acid-binding protein
VIVVDASAYVELLLGQVSESVEEHFRTDLAAPDLLFVEIGSALARSVRRAALSWAEGAFLLEQALAAPIAITATRELVGRAFELRGDLTLYDACYVALAEQLDCAVLTSDRRLAAAPGLPVPVTLV